MLSTLPLELAGLRPALNTGRWTRCFAQFIAVIAVLLQSTATQALNPNKPFHNYVRDTWSIDQGLPQIAVSAITQDHAGYLWVGTLGGLARFDGVHFTSFPASSEGGPSSNLIQTLEADQNRVWIGTQKGLAYFAQNRIVKIRPPEGADLTDVDVQAILLPNDGSVQVATTTGLYRVVDDQLVADSTMTHPLYAMIETDAGLWYGGWGGVFHSDSDGSKLETLPGLGLHDTVLHLAATDDGGNTRIWAGTSAGLFFRDRSGWHRFDVGSPLALASIGMLYKDSDENLWVGTPEGLSRVRDSAVVEQIDNDRMGSRWDYLSAFEDREGNLWLGSRTHGLSRLWSGLTTRYSVQEGLSTPLVWSVGQNTQNNTDRRVWVGSDNGLWLLEHQRFHNLVPGSVLPDPNVYTLFVEADDTVWLGTLHGAALYRNGRIETPPALAPMNGLRINGIYRDRQKRLWFATSNGLYRYLDGALTRYGETSGLTDPSVRLIYETRDGRLLLGTQYGLGEFVDNHVQMLAGATLPDDIDVTAIHDLPDGRLIIGTTGEQLFVENNGRWTKFDHDNGLPQNSVFFITHDDRGYLWVSGIRGIYRLRLAELSENDDGEPRRLQADIFGDELGNRSTGQRGECCNGAGNGKGFLRDQALWLPTRDGVLAVPTAHLTYNPVPPSIVIESATSSSANWDAALINGKTLPAGARDLSFKFTALSFQDPYSVTLQYRLVGYDHDWRPLKDSLTRFVDYTNLPPGDYILEVRGANNAGVWNDVPAQLRFRIPPYFRETVWFYLAIGAFLAWLIYLAHRWQLRTLTRRRLELERLVAERTDALALANQQLEAASYTDPLTGLLNRRYLLNQLPQDLAFYRRNAVDFCESDDVLLFVLIDIDHFKRINDTYGHSIGDLVLRRFSTLLTELVRIGDYVTRWGGEEFLIVSRPVPRQHAASYISRICCTIASHPFEVGGETPLRVSCSIGYSEYPLRDTPPDLDWQQLLELADDALYHVKNSGRNGWASFRFCGHPITPQAIDRLRAHRDCVLAAGEFELLSSIGAQAPRVERIAGNESAT